MRLYFIIMKRIITPIILFFIALFSTEAEATNKVIMKHNGDSITIVLYDNATATDFLSRLPLTIYMEDYDKSALYATLNDSLKTDSVEIKTSQVRELYYYTTTKQIWYNYGVCIVPLPVQSIGRAIEKKNIFQDAFDGAEVLFYKKE